MINYITSKNRIIRSLPILHKIFIGRLSFVGSEMINIYNKNPNHIIKPGLTTLAKLKKFKHKDKNKTNYFYLKNQSLIFDIEILLKSFFKI